eukprot:scaffold12076_cov85-Skeletonema_dohrnii-CCMP3373.AAC.1
MTSLIKRALFEIFDVTIIIAAVRSSRSVLCEGDCLVYHSKSLVAYQRGGACVVGLLLVRDVAGPSLCSVLKGTHYVSHDPTVQNTKKASTAAFT